MTQRHRTVVRNTKDGLVVLDATTGRASLMTGVTRRGLVRGVAVGGGVVVASLALPVAQAAASQTVQTGSTNVNVFTADAATAPNTSGGISRSVTYTWSIVSGADNYLILVKSSPVTADDFPSAFPTSDAGLPSGVYIGYAGPALGATSTKRTITYGSAADHYYGRGETFYFGIEAYANGSKYSMVPTTSGPATFTA